MKTKKFTKLLSMLLVLSTLLTFGTIAASADGGSSDNTLFSLDNGDIDVATGYYTSDTISYYAMYLGTHSDHRDALNGYSRGEIVNLKTAGKFNDSSNRYELGFDDQWTYAQTFQTHYHMMMAVGFTAPKTAVYSFTYQLKMAAMNGSPYKLLIGEGLSPNDKKDTILKGAVADFPSDTTTVKDGTYSIKLKAGATLYFMFVNPDNNGYGKFWLKSVNEVADNTAGKTSWDFGDISTVNDFIVSPVIDYVAYYQGTDPSISSAAGMYDMPLATNNYGNPAYIIGELKDSSGNKSWVNLSYATKGADFAPQYHLSPGLAFTAPYTGTMKFTLQVSFGNVNHRIVVARESEPLTNGGNYTNNIAIYASKDLNVVEDWTVEVDVNAGEQIYFLVDHFENGNTSKMHLKSAEYVIGDLSSKPTYLYGVQETGIVDGKFDVNFISATKDGTYADMGFVYKIKTTKTSDGSTISDGEEVTLEVDVLDDYYEVYGINKDGTPVNRKCPQKTKTMQASVGGLSAEDTTVEITVYSYANVRGSAYSDTAVVIKYVNGVFDSIENVTAE